MLYRSNIVYIWVTYLKDKVRLYNAYSSDIKISLLDLNLSTVNGRASAKIYGNGLDVVCLFYDFLISLTTRFRYTCLRFVLSDIMFSFLHSYLLNVNEWAAYFAFSFYVVLYVGIFLRFLSVLLLGNAIPHYYFTFKFLCSLSVILW